jgi:hypothetical protein
MGIAYRPLQSNTVIDQQRKPHMRSRLLSAASAFGLVLAGSLLALAPASPASAHCSGHGTHPDAYSGGDISFGNGTHIRAYPHIGCDSRGLGYPGQGIDVHCAVVTTNLWFFVRNTTTGVNGWARVDSVRISRPTEIRDCGNTNARHQISP